MQAPESEPLWTIAEAAKYLSISPKHFRRDVIGKGMVDVISLGKSSKGDRILPSDIKQLVENRRRSRCLESAGKFGTSNSKPGGKSFNDPLGLPTSGRHRRSSAN